MEKPKFHAGRFLLVFAASVGLRLWLQSNPNSATEIDKAGFAATQAINKQTPMQIDRETILDSSSYNDRTISYSLHLKSYRAALLPPALKSGFSRDWKSGIVSKACTTPATMEQFKLGVKSKYVLYGSDQVYITEIEISPKDCEDRPAQSKSDTI